MLIIENEVDNAIVASEEAGRVAHRDGALTIERAAKLIIYITVVPVEREGETVCEFAADDRGIEETRSTDLTMSTEIDAELGTELICRAMAHKMDGADLRSTAKESTLRALDNLDALKVEELDNRGTAARDRDLILEDRDTRLRIRRTIIGGHATDDVARIVGALNLDLEARNEVGHIVHLLYAEESNVLASQSIDSHGDIDRSLLTLLSGDHDLAKELIVVSELDVDACSSGTLSIREAYAREDESGASGDGRQDIAAIGIGRDTDSRALDHDGHARQRFTSRALDAACHTDILCIEEHREQQCRREGEKTLMMQTLKVVIIIRVLRLKCGMEV